MKNAMVLTKISKNIYKIYSNKEMHFIFKIVISSLIKNMFINKLG